MEKLIRNRFGQLTTQELDDLQTILESSLKPVAPRQEFLTGLQAGLFAREIQMASFSPASRKFSNGLLVAGGVIGGVLVIIAGIRGLISLFGLIETLVQRSSKPAHIR